MSARLALGRAMKRGFNITFVTAVETSETSVVEVLVGIAAPLAEGLRGSRNQDG